MLTHDISNFTNFTVMVIGTRLNVIKSTISDDILAESALKDKIEILGSLVTPPVWLVEIETISIQSYHQIFQKSIRKFKSSIHHQIAKNI